jgi:PAS domain S-box-containing protein
MAAVETTTGNGRLGPALVTRALSGASVAVGVGVLAGWALDIPSIRSVVPGLVEMKANTALSFVLSGCALWLLAPAGATGRRRVAGRVIAAIVSLLALATMSQHLIGWDLGIDQLLFRESPDAIFTASPGRMAFATTVDFTLIGAALLFLDVRTRRGFWPAQWLALVAGGAALLATIAYLYGASELYGVGPWFTAVAVHTALAFGALALGILTSRPDRGLIALGRRPGVGGTMVRRLTAAATLVPPVLGWLRLEGERAGLYGTAVGVSLYTTTSIAIFTALIWTSGRSLDRADRARSRAEETLRAHAEELDDLYNRAPCGYHSLDAEGVFLRINDTELEWLGYAREEVVGKLAFTDLVTEPSVERFRTNFPRFKREGRIDNLEFEMVRKDGSTFPILLSATAVTDDEGAYLMSRSTVVDITERKRTEVQLHRARAEAERANRAKDEFLSRMSHELRTPLNAVLGFAQILEMDDLGPEQRDGVKQILKGGHHLLGLIDEVLDISRIATGSLSLSPEPVSVTEVVFEAVDLIQPLAAERGIALRAEDANGLHVLADRQRLKQVLLNLLANAVKYNREGGSVDVNWSKAPGDRLRVAVSDTGSGIPAEVLERLFVPFDRLGAEATGVEGTGLGLALSKALTEAMGGAIEVESRVGKGSTFAVELPLAEPQMLRYEREEAGRVEEPAEHGVRTVLYLEDNLSNLRLVERILERRPDLRLISAMQGRLGLELAREHRPDVVLLDLHLPDISGEEALRSLRARPETRRIPVIAISADATSTSAKRLLSRGARDYLTKPLDIQRFLEVLDDALGTGSAGATLREDDRAG